MSRTRPFKVPESVWTACEIEAKKRRRLTGDDVRWTDILHGWITKASKRVGK